MITKRSLFISIIFACVCFLAFFIQNSDRMVVKADSCTVRFFDAETLILQQEVAAGNSLDVPSVQENSVGWYFDGKRINDSVIYPSEDMDIYAKYDTDEFNVEIVYRNLRFKELTETIKVKYGTEFNDDLFHIDEPYGYLFDGWDFSGIVTEDITVTAKYKNYSHAKDFLLDFNGSVKNGNFVSYESLNHVTKLDDNYMYATGIINGSNLVTNQKFINFEMNFDIVEYGVAVLGDNNIIISFGQKEHDMNVYYRKEFAIVLSLNQNPSTKSYYTLATLMKDGQPFEYGEMTPICDESEPLEFKEHNSKTVFVDSHLSPNGKYVNVRLVVNNGRILLQSKFSDETDYKTVINGNIDTDVLGYCSIGYWSNYLNYSYILGIDNFSMKNLDGGESDLDVSTLELSKNSDGIYEYKCCSKDIKADVNFKMQTFGGTNVVIYDEKGEFVEEVSVDLIKEKLYEIGESLTFDKRVLGSIYNQYKEYTRDGKLRLDIVIIAGLDWGCLPLEISEPEYLAAEFCVGDETINTVYGEVGDNISLLTGVTVPFGYKFGGWTDENGNEIIGKLTLTDNYKLYAVFVPTEYMVRFLNYDGSAFYSVKVKYGEKVESPMIDPLGDGTVQFAGWENTDVVITQDTDITAKWTGGGCAGNISGTDVFFILVLCGVFLMTKYIYLRKKNRKSRETL